MRFVLRFVALAVACASASMMLVAPALATFAGQNGKIAFSDDFTGNAEINTINPNGSGQAQVTALGAEDLTPAWSPSGSLIAFASDRGFGDFDIYRTDPAGGSLLTLNDDSVEDASPSWAPTGAELVVSSEGPGGQQDLFRLAADGSGAKINVTNSPGLDETNPSWSADGSKIAFERLPAPGDTRRDIFTINPDGTGLQNVTGSPNADDREPNWSPDSTQIAYASHQNGNYDIYTIGADGTGDLNITNYPPAHDRDPAWSPNGQTIVFVSRRRTDTDDLFLTSAAGGGQTTQITFNTFVHKLSPDWQAAAPTPPPSGGYPRPKGATPFKVPFVLAFQQCNSPNRNHGPPLAFPSCNPPVEQSTAVTVGTPETNGAAANSEGSMRLDVQVGAPGAPDDSDVMIVASITDVRCKVGTSTCDTANANDGPDYTGGLQSTLISRITDRFNAVSAGGGSDAATVVDIPYPTNFACTATASTALGAACTANTSMNAIVPGSIKDGKRQIWEFQQATLSDGGPDGVTGTAPNTLFAVQGVFVP
jgi:hypothetical protein